MQGSSRRTRFDLRRTKNPAPEAEGASETFAGQIGTESNFRVTDDPSRAQMGLKTYKFRTVENLDFLIDNCIQQAPVMLSLEPAQRHNGRMMPVFAKIRRNARLPNLFACPEPPVIILHSYSSVINGSLTGNTSPRDSKRQALTARVRFARRS